MVKQTTNRGLPQSYVQADEDCKEGGEEGAGIRSRETENMTYPSQASTTR
jgi:hypothetical protein